MKNTSNKSNYSVSVSLGLVVFFGVLLFALDIAAPWLVPYVARFLLRGVRFAGSEGLLLAVFYVTNIPAYLLLYHMFRLLRSIGEGEIFTEKNVSRLRIISLCCFVAALLCFCAVFCWPDLVLVILAAVFMGFIVRVVQSIIQKTVSMKDELDFLV